MAFRVSIRAKLLFLTVAVLAIPYAGYEYLRELERHLRDSFEAGLTDAARAAAGPLHDRDDLFPVGVDGRDHTLYVHRLAHPIQIDGYTDDWLSYIDWSTSYSTPDPADGEALSYRFIVSRHAPYYYALLQVRDERLVYQRPDTPDAVDNDHVVLVFTDPYGVVRRYHFSPAAPGRLRPFRFYEREDEFGFEYRSTEFITNVSGEWQSEQGGYNLEIALPISLVGERLGLLVVDVDDPDGRGVVAEVGTAGADTLLRPGRIVQSSPQIQRMIDRFVVEAGRRIWVLDRRGEVLASSGSLEKPLAAPTPATLFRFILPAIYERFRDDLAGASRLGGQEVQEALRGTAGTRWRESPDGRAVIVSAAAPVFSGNEIRGAVVTEETTSGIQMLQREAMISLFTKTFLVFLLVTGAVLLFATRLSWRLRRLSAGADAAVDEHGRVIGAFRPSTAGDEVGELSRTYAAMLERLQGYHDYLESMAGKLSHELRTPITIVRSSLEHLAANGNDAGRKDYLERATDGIRRLDLIVTRLSEAARLEQALQGTARSPADIGDLVQTCVDGYAMAYADVGFRFSRAGSAARHAVSAELLEQMLDKMVANAVDFHEPGTTVDVTAETGADGWSVAVTNTGPPLPPAMEAELFNSMVSVRGTRDARGPHLGLGLYIVRLIAEFHGARVRALNLPDGTGVRFEVRYPAGGDQ